MAGLRCRRRAGQDRYAHRPQRGNPAAIGAELRPTAATEGKERRIRIAKGSGTKVEDVNKLMKQHRQMADMMKKVSKGGLGSLSGIRHRSGAELGLGAVLPIEERQLGDRPGVGADLGLAPRGNPRRHRTGLRPVRGRRLRAGLQAARRYDGGRLCCHRRRATGRLYHPLDVEV